MAASLIQASGTSGTRDHRKRARSHVIARPEGRSNLGFAGPMSYYVYILSK
jgi:hypothetical protein